METSSVDIDIDNIYNKRERDRNREADKEREIKTETHRPKNQRTGGQAYKSERVRNKESKAVLKLMGMSCQR